MKERIFTMELSPTGFASKVFMDGEDISGLLRGVTVHSDVDGGTTVELQPATGCRSRLTIRLPEARITVMNER